MHFRSLVFACFHTANTLRSNQV